MDESARSAGRNHRIWKVDSVLIAREEERKLERLFSGFDLSSNEREPLIIQPSGRIYFALEFIRGVGVIIDLLFCPLDFTFKLSHYYVRTFLVILLLIDSLFLFQTLVDMTCMAFLEHGVLQTSKRKIAKKFFSNWLTICYRLIVIPPFYLISPELCLIKIFTFFEIHKALGVFPLINEKVLCPADRFRSRLFSE